jgi:hypothetical protein
VARQTFYRIKRIAWNRSERRGDRWVDLPDLWSAQYKRGVNGEWQYYRNEAPQDSWEKAYAILEKHATPAALAVHFVGTF